ncbi:MAG: RDD family protein [Gemmatimonadetes bacterium]|nr:RDD family protein [Gemmatimonadota bacterium]
MAQDPRAIITPASFAVAPELLGLPLARPWQRAVAMLLDLGIVAILANAGGGVLFGLAAAFGLWRASRALAGRRFSRTLRLGGAFVLFVVVVSNWGFWNRRPRKTGDDADARTSAVAARLGDVGTIADVVALKRARTPEAARQAADRLVARMREKGLGPEQLQEVLASIEESDGDDAAAIGRYTRDALAAAFAAALDTAARPRAEDGDSLVRAYLAAVDAGRPSEARELRRRLAPSFAGDTLAALERRVASLRLENARLAARVARDSARSRGPLVGIVDSFANAGDEIVRLLKQAGLGFGWLGLYFTAFVALMRGQTPGKRILGIRIVRLDGRPMGWWASFERFGGYAASIVTGLGGFFQILWDKNRQGVHDKIAETVVVQT